jgi:hypothetical protein
MSTAFESTKVDETVNLSYLQMNLIMVLLFFMILSIINYRGASLQRSNDAMHERNILHLASLYLPNGIDVCFWNN